VCGDARRMAKDVDATLRKIVQEQGGNSIEQANEYVEKLKNENGTSAMCIRTYTICHSERSAAQSRNLWTGG